MNRPTRSKLFERRREVANYALKGWTQAAIARQMHIPEASVSRDLAAMREFWREFPVYDFDRARLEQGRSEPGFIRRVARPEFLRRAWSLRVTGAFCPFPRPSQKLRACHPGALAQKRP